MDVHITFSRDELARSIMGTNFLVYVNKVWALVGMLFEAQATVCMLFEVQK